MSSITKYQHDMLLKTTYHHTTHGNSDNTRKHAPIIVIPHHYTDANHRPATRRQRTLGHPIEK